MWLTVFNIFWDSELYGDYSVNKYEWQFKLASATDWTTIDNSNDDDWMLPVLYCRPNQTCPGHLDYDKEVIAITNLEDDLYEFRVRSKAFNNAVPEADRISDWTQSVSGTPGDYPERWHQLGRKGSYYIYYSRMLRPDENDDVIVEAHRAYFNHLAPQEYTGSQHFVLTVSSYEYVLIPEDQLCTFGQITDSKIVPNLQNFPDLDRGKPYTYLCSYTVCFAGLPADSSFYVGARGLNQRGHVSTWTFTESGSQSSLMLFKTQDGSDFTPTPTGTRQPVQMELEDEDYAIGPPAVSVDGLDSLYSPGDDTTNRLTLDLTIAPPHAAVHAPESLLEFKVGVATGEGAARGQDGYLHTCGRSTTCRFSLTTEVDNAGRVLSDAHVLWFWAEALWETDESALSETFAPIERTYSPAISLRNALMVGRDPRNGETRHFLGQPNASYQMFGGSIAVSVDGLVLPESRVADHYQTKVNDRLDLFTREAEGGLVQYVVPLPDEESGLGYISVRTRARVCADAEERRIVVDDGDPSTGDIYTIRPYNCLYSFWDPPWTPPNPVIRATPQPEGAVLRRENDPHPRIEGATEEILNTIMPIDEGRERPGMDDWLVLFCLLASIGAALSFGLAGGTADGVFTAFASGAFAFVLVFGLLGTRLFGIENGMAFIVCVMPTIAGVVFLKVRFF